MKTLTKAQKDYIARLVYIDMGKSAQSNIGNWTDITKTLKV